MVGMDRGGSSSGREMVAETGVQERGREQERNREKRVSESAKGLGRGEQWRRGATRPTNRLPSTSQSSVLRRTSEIAAVRSLGVVTRARATTTTTTTTRRRRRPTTVCSRDRCVANVKYEAAANRNVRSIHTNFRAAGCSSRSPCTSSPLPRSFLSDEAWIGTRRTWRTAIPTNARTLENRSKAKRSLPSTSARTLAVYLVVPVLRCAQGSDAMLDDVIDLSVSYAP